MPSVDTDNKSNEALLKKAMTTKYPSMLVLMEIAEELAQKNCELQLQRGINQLADDLTNEEFKEFDSDQRIDLRGEDFKWRTLDRLLAHADSLYRELGTRKREAPRSGS